MNRACELPDAKQAGFRQFRKQREVPNETGRTSPLPSSVGKMRSIFADQKIEG